MNKQSMTDAIVSSKAAKGLTWESMGAVIGVSPVWLASACLGMNSATSEIAKAIADGGGTANITTLEGSAIKASMAGGKIVLEDGAGNKATVIKADIPSSNGTLHIVDTVLMPG